MSYIFFQPAFYERTAPSDVGEPAREQKQALLGKLIKEWRALMLENPFTIQWDAQFIMQTSNNIKMLFYPLTGPDGLEPQFLLRNVTITLHERENTPNTKTQYYATIRKFSPLDIIPIQICSMHLYNLLDRKEKEKKNDLQYNTHLTITNNTLYPDCALDGHSSKTSWLPFLSIVRLGPNGSTTATPDEIHQYRESHLEIIGSAIIKLSKVRDVGNRRLIKVGLSSICATSIQTAQETTLNALIKQVQRHANLDADDAQ